MYEPWKKLLILAVATCCTAAYAAPFVELSDGRVMKGIKIRAKLNQDVILTTERGEITYVKGQYKRAVADKPAQWDSLEKQVKSNPKAAIPALEGIIKELKNLEWDLRAMGLLGAAQVGSGDTSSGISTYESLFRKSAAMKNSEARWGYYNALVSDKQYNKLEVVLKNEIKDGTRADAAKAQIIRGDILVSQGDTEAAAMDYLKTVLLYKKERDVQPEALFKAGEALEKLKDPRASAQFKEIVQNYPSSPWAGKARGKL